ncbi:MAG TPA: TspO/MBR family protein [Ilumatobacteraceae bacterium]|nr:TspO/MBR family protein [Ilumatobacteraceae bacterium]
MQTSTVRRPHPVGESVLAAVLFAIATVAVAGLGSLATSSGMDWYETLEKPGFTPPGATFGIVWTILYVAIAVAGWLAWRASASTRPTVWWAAQMALNLLWTAVFFGLESPVGGIVVIAALLAAVVMDLRASARVDTTAAVLLFPYLVWCGFAAALTVGVAVLN